ncbi:MAG: outer membrane protein assembly factor BamD [Flavobacteriaceae bacterium]|nr:outer membrane protein assembly factor BamD [Flavobacteriaceae bacterium]
MKSLNFKFVTFLLIFLFSCNEYQNLLKSDNNSEKFREAENFYNSGDFKRANRLFEDVLPFYRGKPQAERLIFFHANSYYNLKMYYLSAAQFENFIKSYPKSEKLEEAIFMTAKCYYMLSPAHSLDQKDTNTAIEKLQIFINNYPSSIYVQEANNLISELQEKLEKKEFEISKQYYTIRDYKAAIRSVDNFIGEFAGTKYREEAMYYKFLSSYEIAINSIQSKKIERLMELKQLHSSIIKYYPETIFLEQLSSIMLIVEEEINTFAQIN